MLFGTFPIVENTFGECGDVDDGDAVCDSMISYLHLKPFPSRRSWYFTSYWSNRATR